MADSTFAARHTSTNPDWITPPEIVGPAKILLGAIDLDPASDVEAQGVIGATRYFTVEEDGLQQAWWGNVFLNPPGGLVNEFWVKLMNEWLAREERSGVYLGMKQFLWVGYSLEQLQTLQLSGALAYPHDFPICYPRKRIAFLENTAKREARREKAQRLGLRFVERANSPSHANYLVYGGPHMPAFAAIFGRLGKVVIPQ